MNTSPYKGMRLKRIKTNEWISNTHYEDPRETHRGLPLCDYDRRLAERHGKKIVKRSAFLYTTKPISCRVCIAIRKGEPIEAVLDEIYGKLKKA